MKVEVKRIDHLGIVAGTIKDLGIVEMVDNLLGKDPQQDITKGEVVAGMILNGLGFVSKPLMLASQFFNNKPLELFLRKGIDPEHFNRHKISRVLDCISDYESEKLFNAIALEACKREEVDMTFGHADTTSYSLTGEYDSDSDTERIAVTYGHSKDCRPDLKQVVQEIVTSQDGGIPFITKSWSGNESDVIILRGRAEALMDAFSKSGRRVFVADSKLYNAKTAKILNTINFITRVPSSIRREQEVICLALQNASSWKVVEKGYKLQEFAVDMYGIEGQRWIVCYSQQAYDRARNTLQKEVKREEISIAKQLYHLQAQRFACQVDAQNKLHALAKKWKFHCSSQERFDQVKCCKKRGRPGPNDAQECEWKISVQTTFDQVEFDRLLDQRSCFVLASNVPSERFSPSQVLAGYKGQDKTEKGFAFLKSNEFFTTSLFLKKPSRIDALLMIMVLALLVYSLAQRRLRKSLALLCLTVPNQINKPITNPTMRWIFQLFEGIDHVSITIDGVKTEMIEGIDELRKKIINLLSVNVQHIYQISMPGG